MVTRGLTKKQIQEGVKERIPTVGLRERKRLEEEHDRIIRNQINIHGSERISKFESHYLAEYNSFSSPFRLTKRIKEYRAGKVIVYDYQVVYKNPKTGRNTESPLRQYIKDVNKKIDEAYVFGIHGNEAQHLRKHLLVRLQDKHIQSLRTYIRLHK